MSGRSIVSPSTEALALALVVGVDDDGVDGRQFVCDGDVNDPGNGPVLRGYDRSEAAGG
ncbi:MULTISPECIES: hypothetical protein [unclassified Streptomyces]|uniref:hypothetical protein n=1 Tax=unclassified Streptomyces TaxID=2593676 RepID=UPI00382AB08F